MCIRDRGEDDLADDGASNAYVGKVREYAKETGSEVFVICAQIEEEISELDDDEKQMFLEDLGLKESGLEKLIKASYSLLGLLSYLTAGETETRAWTIRKGTKAPQDVYKRQQGCKESSGSKCDHESSRCTCAGAG